MIQRLAKLKVSNAPPEEQDFLINSYSEVNDQSSLSFAKTKSGNSAILA